MPTMMSGARNGALAAFSNFAGSSTPFNRRLFTNTSPRACRRSPATTTNRQGRKRPWSGARKAACKMLFSSLASGPGSTNLACELRLSKVSIADMGLGSKGNVKGSPIYYLVIDLPTLWNSAAKWYRLLPQGNRRVCQGHLSIRQHTLVEMIRR